MNITKVMVIENNNKPQEQKEMIQQEIINESNTIEHVLQEKFQDPEKKDFFMKLFNHPLIKNTYQEKSLIQFIRGEKKINKFYRENKDNTYEQNVRIIIEMIDVFDANKGNVTDINVNAVLENDATNKENDVTNKENDVTNKENDVTNKEMLKGQIAQIKEAREATKQSYDALTEEYKTTDEQVQDFKSNPENQLVIEKIKEKLQDTNLNIDEYIRFYMTANTYQEKLQGTTFMINYEKLSRLLEIPPQKISMKRAIADKEQVDDITTTNPSLDTYTKTSSKLNSLRVPDLPKTKDFDEEFALYVKFISDEDLKSNITRNKDLIKAYLTSTDEAKKEDKEGMKAYQEYAQAIQEVKEYFPERTKELIKQRVLGTCITGLATYFDTTTVNQENLADMLVVDTKKGFSITKGERKYDEADDDVLYINGTIKGHTIGFYYNLDNPDAQLKSDDFLHFDTTSEAFVFGSGMGGKKQLGVKLPTISMLTIQAQAVMDKQFTDELKKASDIEDFETRIKEQISKELLKNYRQKALVQTRVERDCEKNIVAQILQKTFVPEVVALELNRGDRSINKVTETNVWRILDIRDKTTEYMRSDELRRFRSLIKRLDPLITSRAKTPQDNLEPYRQRLLEDIHQERISTSYNSQRGVHIGQFFERFSLDRKVNLDDMETFVTALEKQESISENITKFSPDFQTTEEQADADELLQQVA